MKIFSWNVNGIRSAWNKGLQDFILNEKPDILCLQEIKANENQFPPEIFKLGYHINVSSALKPGYAGVAVLSKNRPTNIEWELGLERFDAEGRMLCLDYPDFTLVNLYLPHGGRKKENLSYKLEVYSVLLKYLKSSKKDLILIGDFNIAHSEIDLARPKNNKNNIMFTAEERKQLDVLIQLGFVDTFREYHFDGEHYTWWPYMANARSRNLGWRIDYCFVSKDMRSKLLGAEIFNNVPGSDHCPIEIVLK